jgi:hypothetical protein
VKISPILFAFVFLWLLTGCHTYDVNGTTPVRYANTVQVISLDSTQRPFSKAIEIFQNPDELHGRAYRKIALLSHEGWPNDETLLVNALIWKAKSLGADGVILMPSTRNGYEFNAFAHSGVSYTFHAQAIVFDRPIP